MLERLKSPTAGEADWKRLHDLYLPLIRIWLSRLTFLGADAEDLSQEVWLVVLRKLPQFERQRDGSFRTWLRQVTLNQIRNARRKQRQHSVDESRRNQLEQLEDPKSQLSRQWDEDHDRHVFARLMEMVRSDFAPNTWAIFLRFAIDGVAARRVASDFQVSEAAVLQAKSRILRRLRETAAGLVD